MQYLIANDKKLIKRLKQENEDLKEENDKLRKTLHKDRISRCTSVDECITSSASSKWP